MTIRPHTPAAENVVRGWFGQPVPPPVKHRNKSRAAYRKTTRQRPSIRRPPAEVAHVHDRGRL